VSGRTFYSPTAAFNYQKEMFAYQISRIEPSSHYGGSLLISVPLDEVLLSPPFVTGSFLQPWQQDYLLRFLKNDFAGVAHAFETSGIFDSVASKQASTYLKYSRDHGFRYLLVNNGDLTYTIYDLLLDKDKTVRGPKGLDNLVYLVEDAVHKFEKEVSSKTLLDKATNKQSESLIYDDNTRRGKISIVGKGLEARAYLLTRIGEICSTKNVLLTAGQKANPGFYRILNESLTKDRLEIDFQAPY
jgi:hypothetical protein